MNVFYPPDNKLFCLLALPHLTSNLHRKLDFRIPVLQLRKVWFRKLRKLARSHRESKRQGRSLNRVCLAPGHSAIGWLVPAFPFMLCDSFLRSHPCICSADVPCTPLLSPVTHPVVPLDDSDLCPSKQRAPPPPHPHFQLLWASFFSGFSTIKFSHYISQL